MIFYLGAHITRWLERTTVPLFVSHRRLLRLKKLPAAAGLWILDSGGFTELSLYGEWKTGAQEYVRFVRRYRDEIGKMQHAAIQDWMCEPFITKKTGLTVAEHQMRTIRSYQELMSLDSSVPWLPVVQGWERDDYLRCVELYDRAGVNLSALSLVGLGSVCRRQGTHEGARIVSELAALGIRLHGFGYKLQGLALVSHLLVSSDSLAWSFDARRSPPLPGCTHKNCANCLRFALRWYREKVLPVVNEARYRQGVMAL